MRILQQDTVADYYPVNWGGAPQYLGPVAPNMPNPVHGVEVESIFADPANALAPPGECIGCMPPMGAVQVYGREISPVAAAVGGVLSLTGTIAGAYHGYKRNRSWGWAIGWALLGGMFPIITLPVSLAQGFGKPKGSK